VFTRVITDRARGFDRIEAGYHGPLYAEISPRHFRCWCARARDCPSFGSVADTRRSMPPRSPTCNARERLVDSDDADFDGGISVSVDLAASGAGTLIGYRAKRHNGCDRCRA